MAGHCHEADIDVALFAPTYFVDCRAHVVVDATSRNSAKDTECVIMGIKQHLVCLETICPDNERAAVAQLRMGHLQFWCAHCR